MIDDMTIKDGWGVREAISVHGERVVFLPAHRTLSMQDYVLEHKAMIRALEHAYLYDENPSGDVVRDMLIRLGRLPPIE